MASRVDAARAVARRSLPRSTTSLEEWLRVPSVSGDPAHRGDVEHAAAMVGRLLRTMTPQVKILAGTGGPVVLARIEGGRRARGLPAVAVYGHLDVRPAGPGWTRAPFRPTRVGSRLFARGASDDKGQLMAHLVALQAWHRVGGPPCDVALIVDGAEEIGSPGLRALLRKQQRRPMLAGPFSAVLVSDTRLASPGRPSLTVSQRGVLALRVSVDVGGAPVHSGRFGGAVVDPSLVLAETLRTSALTVSDLRLRRPPAASPTDTEVRAATGGRAVVADRPASRSTQRGALTVSAMRSGGTPGSIPTRATADLDVRFPAGVSSAEVLARVMAGVRRTRSPGVTVSVVPTQSVEGILLEHSPSVLAAVRRACVAGFGHSPVVMSSGGSIPAIGILRDTCKVSPVLLGLGPADDGAHGPDEYLDLDDWARAVDTSVVLLACLARSFPRTNQGDWYSGDIERLPPSAGFRRLEDVGPGGRATPEADSGRPTCGCGPTWGGRRW